MEAVLNMKFMQLVRNMPLETVKDTLSEDQVSQGSERNAAPLYSSDVGIDYDEFAEADGTEQ